MRKFLILAFLFLLGPASAQFQTPDEATRGIGAGATCSTVGGYPVRKGNGWACSTDVVSVKDFGAVGDGNVDDTVAIQAAISTGKTVHMPAASNCYKVTAGINFSQKGQFIFGDGRTRSVICVSTVFANGVLNFGTGEPGPILQDFGITFTQPDTATRGNLTAYPPAINVGGTPRFKIFRMRITAAMTGINMVGNSGGSTINDLEISAFTAAINMDGPLDTVRLNKIHIWSFGLTTNQATIFQNTATLGINAGRVDDLIISDSLSLAGTSLTFAPGVDTNCTFGTITNFGFDTTNGINISCGTITVASSYFTLASGYYAINQTGGSLNLSSVFISIVAFSSATPIISITDATSPPIFTWSSGFAALSTGDITLLKTNSSSAAASHTQVENVYVTHTANTAYTRPVFWSVVGRVTLIGNRINDKGTGAGVFIQIDADDYHRVMGNAAPGWTLITPNTATNGVYVLNAPVATTAQIWSPATNAVLDAGNVFNAAGAIIAAGGTSSAPTFDFSTGFNFSFLATSATNYTIQNPTNVKVGQTGCLFLSQPTAGSVVTVAYQSNWKFPGGTAPPLTATLSALDVLCYIARSSVLIVGSMNSNVK